MQMKHRRAWFDLWFALIFSSQDYSTPKIDLFTELNGMGRMSSFCDDTIETCSFGIPQSTGSIKVHCGV